MKPLILTTLLIATPAAAHNSWTNGEEVPAWVKADCCGKADAHHLETSAVHVMADGYHIDGLTTVVPFVRALPSQDGSYWAFFNPEYVKNHDDPLIYCFFAPVNGS